MHKNYLLKIIFLFTLALFLVSCGTKKKPAPIIKGTPPTKTAPTPPGYYRVKKGDNLYRIGLRHNLSVTYLKRINNIINEHEIEVGQLIKVSSYGSTTSSPTPPSYPNTQKQYSQIQNLNIIWPVKGRIISRFNGKNNKGVDIASTMGESVLAAANGKVMYAESMDGYGNLILISHDTNNSILTAYGHNDKLLVHKGQSVTKGQKIATVGSEDTTSPRVHFEIRYNGKAVNPEIYLN